MKKRKLENAGSIGARIWMALNLASKLRPGSAIDDAIKVIREAHSKGVYILRLRRKCYDRITSETIVGGALEPFRNEVKIATQVWLRPR